MSKRTDAIRSMFSAPPEEMLSADNMPSAALPRVSSGSVRSLKDTFSGVERENEDLRAQLGAAKSALELDPALIDPSPLADRFQQQDTTAFEILKASIRDRGQEIAILVRKHPTIDGRYQCAYGHRRLQAAKELGLSVKANVRTMSDEELVVAQGIENSAREDLSFIERAVFSAKLEDAGFQRSVVQTALSIDRAEASKLISVAHSIPGDLVSAIGRAPKVGRGRWQSLADALKSESALVRARRAVKRRDFEEQATDVRFLTVLSAAHKSEAAPTQVMPLRMITSRQGDEIARAALTETHLKLTVDRSENDGFAEFIVEMLPTLFDAYAEKQAAGNRRED